MRAGRLVCLVMIAWLLAPTGRAAAFTPSRGQAAAEVEEVRRQLGDLRFELEVASLAAWLDDPAEALPAEAEQFVSRLRPALATLRQELRRPIMQSIGGQETRTPAPLAGIEERPPALALALAVEAMSALRADDGQRAAEYLADAYRLSKPAGDTDQLAGVLRGHAIFEVADQATRWGLDRAHFGPQESSAILDAMRGLDERNPFRVRQGIQAQTSFVLPWLFERYAGPEGLAELRPEFAESIADPVLRTGLGLIDERAFAAHLSMATAAIDRVLEAMESNDAERTRIDLCRIDEGVRHGEHGILARATFPEFARVHEHTYEISDKIHDRREVLSAIAAETKTPMEAANAAVWYGRAAWSGLALSRSQRERLRMWSDFEQVPLDEDAKAMLEGTSLVIADLLHAASLERCDFSVLETDVIGEPQPYHAGLRVCARLLQVDAVDHLRRGERAAALRRFGACFDLAGHLTDDPSITSALLGHTILETTLAHLEPGLRGDVFEPRERMALLSHVRSVGYRDPFGYGDATRTARARLAQWIVERTRLRGIDRRLELERWLSRCDADQLLFLLAAAAFLNHDEALDPMAVSSQLVDVIPASRMARVREVASDVADVLGTENFRGLLERRVPSLGSVAEHQERARDDVRQALVSIRGNAELPGENDQ